MQLRVQSVEPRPAAAAAQVGKINIGALGRALWRRKFLIAGLTLLAAAIAFAAVNLITPRYKSETRILIETRESFLRPYAERVTERETIVDQEVVARHVQVLLSRNLAREIIEKLGLAERPEFDPLLSGTSLWRALLNHAGIIKNPMDMTPEERVIESYYERLSAFRWKNRG